MDCEGLGERGRAAFLLRATVRNAIQSFPLRTRRRADCLRCQDPLRRIERYAGVSDRESLAGREGRTSRVLQPIPAARPSAVFENGAVVRSIAAAASGQIGFRIHGRHCRSDQREAEQRKQQCCPRTAHRPEYTTKSADQIRGTGKLVRLETGHWQVALNLVTPSSLPSVYGQARTYDQVGVDALIVARRLRPGFPNLASFLLYSPRALHTPPPSLAIGRYCIAVQR